MTIDLSRARLDELLANYKRTNNSDLQYLQPADAMDEITNTLLDFRAYCKGNKLELLNYLLEMAILEAIEVQMSPTGGDHAGAAGPVIIEPPSKKESHHDDHGGIDV